MTPTLPTLSREHALLDRSPLVFALDEVGRGALAGPVTIGVSVLDAGVAGGPVPEGLRDSKLVPEARRPEVAERAARWVRASGLGWATAGEVDEFGIIRALGLAALRALASVESEGFAPASGVVLLDGNHDYITPAGDTVLDVRTVVKGDRDCASLAAASVIAKVARDSLMTQLDADFPVYGWARNKGYASASHRSAIRDHGLSAHHRRSWAIADAPALF